MRKLNQVLSDYEMNLPVPEKKKILRKILIDERQKLSEITKSQDWGSRQFFRALELLKVTNDEINKKNINRKFVIACYFPIKNELDISCFADEDWLFPKTSGNGIIKWFEYGDGKKDLIRNNYGILEKPEELCFEYSSDMPPMLCFVPGLAASQDGYRLGYGGGYYDRFINKMNKRITTVFCLPSDKFVFDEIPFDENDQKIDLVVW